MRDLHALGLISPPEVDAFIRSLARVNGRLCVQDISTAEWFVELYYADVIDHFHAPVNVYANHVLASAIRRSMELGDLHEQHLFTDDATVLGLMQAGGDEQVRNWLASLTPDLECVEDPHHYDIHGVKKLRIIDPLVLTARGPERASRLSRRVAAMNARAREKGERGSFVRALTAPGRGGEDHA